MSHIRRRSRCALSFHIRPAGDSVITRRVPRGCTLNCIEYGLSTSTTLCNCIKFSWIYNTFDPTIKNKELRARMIILIFTQRQILDALLTTCGEAQPSRSLGQQRTPEYRVRQSGHDLSLMDQCCVRHASQKRCWHLRARVVVIKSQCESWWRNIFNVTMLLSW